MAQIDPFKANKPAQNTLNTNYRFGIDVSKLPVEDLLDLRQQVEAALPAKSIKDLNMAQELVLQMQALQSLQNRTLQDPDLPPNQVAQTCNALSNSLKMLADMQVSVYSSERMKAQEAILIKLLDKLPEEMQQAFLADYERLLAA